MFLPCGPPGFQISTAVRIGKQFAVTVRGGVMATPKLQYFEKAQVAGIPGESLVVRAANGRVLGRFCGLVIDPLDQHLRFLVVRATGWFGRTTLVPASSPRLDLDGCAIEIDTADSEVSLLRNLTLRKALDLGMCARAV